MLCLRLESLSLVAASKDKARAILSYATPNPVGPYRLVTPPTPDLGVGKTKTPILPVMGGTLVNLPTPVAPTKQTTPAAPPLADKFINVPKQQGRVVDKSGIDYTDPDLFIEQVPRYPKNLDSNANPNAFGDRLARTNREYIEDAKLGKHLDQAAKKFSANDLYRTRYEELLTAAKSFGKDDKTARRTASLNMYRDIRDMRSYDIPDAVIPKILSIKGTEPLLEFFGGNINKQRAKFVGGDFTGGNVSDYDFFYQMGRDLKGLTPAGQETYVSLLPGWTGTHKELADAARSLSK